MASNDSRFLHILRSLTDTYQYSAKSNALKKNLVQYFSVNLNVFRLTYSVFDKFPDFSTLVEKSMSPILSGIGDAIEELKLFSFRK